MPKKLTKLPAKKVGAKKLVGKTAITGKLSPAPALQRHFEKAGVRFDLKPKQILAQVKKLMGRKRHAEWWNASISRQEGRGSSEAEYQALKTAEEINTLFSLQSHVSLTVCEWLARQVANSGVKRGRIGDLGCGSGVLAAWLASQHLDCQVIGWDSMSNIVEAATSSQKAPNLSFATWNYAQASCPEPHSCDSLVTCFGVDFPLCREMHRYTADITSLRNGEYYQKMFGVMRQYFQGWRTAIKDRGHLHAVLRVSSDVLFLATVDAAQDAGWNLELGPYEYLGCGDERFAAMTFRAVSAPPHSEEVILSLWCRSDFKVAFASEINSAAAICAFKSLAAKTILKTHSRNYDDGHTMEAVVGTAGFLGFQYSNATTGFARLKLMSLDEAATAEPWFPEPAFTFDDWDRVW